MSTHASTFFWPLNKMFQKPKAPTPPPPPAPLPKLEQAMPGEEGTRRRPRRGRSSTILTGDLIPMDIGKKTLLG
jgi:hypothetical protein